MQGIERNRFNYNALLQRTQQRESLLNQEWKKQDDSKNHQLQQEAYLKKNQNKQSTQQASTLSRSQNVSRVQSVQSIENIDSSNEIEINTDAVRDKPFFINFDDAERFNLQEDLVNFVKPTHNNAIYFDKDNLTKAGNKIILHLELVGASEALIKRAETLFKEEENVKAVMNAYKNALVFS